MQPPAPYTRSRALLPLLVGALVLTVLSALVSTAVVAEQRARDIEDAADSIAYDAMPSIVQLARMRSELRRMEGLLIEHVHRIATGKDASDLVAQIVRARAEIDESWELERR